jgi:hypothetical protein
MVRLVMGLSDLRQVISQRMTSSMERFCLRAIRAHFSRSQQVAKGVNSPPHF